MGTSTELEAPQYSHMRDISSASDATVVPQRNTTPEHPVRTKEPLRTSISRFIIWVFVSGGTLSLPVMVILCFVPILGLFVLPAVACLITALVYGVSHLAYLLLAQEDAPPRRTLPFVTWSWSRCLRVDRAVFMYLREGFRLLALYVGDWFYRKIAGAKVSVKSNIHYGSPRPNMRLDVYIPLSFDGITDAKARPTIVFLPPQLRFLPRGRALFSSLGRNLASQLECIVVIPDISTYPSGGRIPQQMEDTRIVLRWVAEHVGRYGGDAKKVYLAGHGQSGLLALLVPVQQAVVQARDLEELGKGKEVPNGLRDLSIYAREVLVPDIAGIIMFSGIADVDRHIIYESMQGVHNISLVRRICGPTQKTSLQHSPNHLLYASRNFDVKRRLPQKFLLIHGGLDQSVEHIQSEMMKELLRGISVTDVRLSVYEEIGHWGIILGLMGRMRGSTSRAVTNQLFAFLHD
ncbi:alpha/beta-hydrolase [Exidia glandulosa HHB12029]|uniref:Alpha/beta-hydrolase n=1 Tax=Exidia glandulosa HHB12029 TaxID=1314781 RepID=A0A165DHL8_EXIGL|nr:alpha/beta-hydrolase [Exidia glandulosa HHB12029]